MDRLSQIEVTTNQAHSGMLTLRRNEKDFLLRSDTSYHDKFNSNYNALQATTESLRSDLAEVGLPEQKAKQLVEILSKYKDKFDALLQKSVEIGLTPQTGFYGALRNAVHAAEEQVDKVENDALKADMLMLRRHEKDFMLRSDMKYSQRFDESFDDFMTTLRQSALPAQNKEEIERLMNNYNRHFAAFVEGQKQLGLTSKEGLMGQVRDQVRATEALLAELSSEIQEQIKDYRAQTRLLSSVVSTLTIIFIIAVVILVSLSISRPVKYLADLMKKISDDKDLSKRYQYDGADEINAVGDSLNQMLERFMSPCTRCISRQKC
ncbi:HAMP domain-containing protein [Lacimicrobium alkaliphilum]|nr:HAMP domain-containing protein [Lacimicrobium alkaliphilum]